MNDKEQQTTEQPKGKSWRSRKSLKTLAMYVTMVTVSTLAIFWLEHATIINALRTALVAAIAKTFAATWVAGIFD